MIDHCISAFNKSMEDKLLKVYVTDTLMAIANNSARFAGGITVSKRFYDIAYKKEVEEERTAEEIIQRIKEKVNGYG